MQARELMVSNGEVKLATVASGERVNGTILLVMGATASMAWWPASLIESLERGGYLVIRFDHRDTGHSTTGAPGKVSYDLDDLASDLMAILDAYSVQRAHVVGMSLGGYLAQIDALRYPDRIVSLTLLASEPFGITYDAEGISDAFMAHFDSMENLDWSNRDAVAAFLVRIAELSAGSRSPFDVKSVRRRVESELSRATNMQSAFNHSMIAGTSKVEQTAADVRQPVLLIHGADDPIISVNAAEKSAQVFPIAELIVLEGMGHELLEQDMPMMSRHILDHCAQAQT